MDEFVPIAIGFAVLAGITYILLNGLRYLFLLSSALLGHPLLLIVAVTCVALLWQLQRIPEGSLPDATLFGQTMSTRRWMILAIASLLVIVSGYGVLVL